MKQFILSLSTFALFIASIFVFASCEKEENTNVQPQLASETNCPTCSETELSLDSIIYVQNHYFKENYNIDVHQFSSNENFQQLIVEINELTSDIFAFMENADSNRLNEAIRFLNQKNNELQEFENSGNTAAMLSAAEEIFAAAMPSKTTNAFLYEGRTYQLPLDYMGTKTETFSTAIHQLKIAYPSLQNMTDFDYETLLQLSFITSEIDGHNGLCYAKADPKPTKEALYKNCLKGAGLQLTKELTAASAAYTYSAIKCAFIPNPIAISLCEIGATGAYGIAVYKAKQGYDIAVENYELKYN